MPANPFQSHQRLLGGLWDRGLFRPPGRECLAGREVRGLAPHPPGRGIAAAGFLGQQHAQDLGGIPTLRSRGRQDVGGGLAQVWHPHPAQNAVELLGQFGCLGAAHDPNPSQPEVPGWAEWFWSTPTTPPTGAEVARWSRIEARSSSPNRPAIAASPSAWPTSVAPITAASSIARVILARIRVTPVAPASTSQRRAPSPRPRNAISNSVRGRVLGSRGRGRAGGGGGGSGGGG